MSTPTTTGTPWGRLIRETQIRFIRGRHPDNPGLGGWLPEYDELMPWQRAACDAEGAAVAAAVRAELLARVQSLMEEVAYWREESADVGFSRGYLRAMRRVVALLREGEPA